MSSEASFWLSPRLRRLWRMSRGAAVPDHYGEATLLGPLNKVRLKEALAVMIQNHEVLRTVLEKPEHLESPVQTVREDAVFDWSEQATIPAADQRRQVQTRDLLDTHPRVRVTLFGEDQTHLLTWRVAASCCDRPGMSLMLREWFEIYATLAQNEAWEDEPVQYAQFTDWLNGLEEDEESGGLAYWQSRNEPVEEDLMLAGGVDLSTATGFATATQTFEPRQIPLTEKDPTDILAASWRLLLSRLVGRDAPLAVLTDGRSFEELETALGVMSVSLPIAMTPMADQSFHAYQRDFASRREEAASWCDFFGHQDRHLDQPQPFGFDASPPVGGFRVADLRVADIYTLVQAEPRVLDLEVLWREGQLSARLHHDPTLLSAPMAKDLLNAWSCLLNHALEDQDRQVRDLPLLDAAGKTAMIQNLNGDNADALIPLPLVDAFEAHAATNPHQTALVFVPDQGNEILMDYVTLNRRANQVAHTLIQNGVRRDDTVALLFQRSADMMVALLGTLKAGAAYLPMDPNWPVERMARIHTGSGAKVLLTHDQAPIEQGGSEDHVTIFLDQTHSAQEHDPRVVVAEHQTAYLIYTSGSTGEPKGAAVTHHNLRRYLGGIIQRLGLEPGLRYGLVSTLAADLGNTSILPALFHGGCLHILSQSRIGNGLMLGEYVAHHQLQVLKMTPTHLEALLECEQPQRIPPERLLVLGGEACSRQLIERLLVHNPALKIWNHYGPSEATVGVTALDLTDLTFGQIPPLGRPLPNACTYVLAEDMTPCFTGVVGELHIGGPTLCLGYRNKPGMTAERFIPDPFSQTPGARMYRSGDLSFVNHEGRLMFKGRTDDQVKIAGYRVELGEIEAALNRHAKVRRSAVLLNSDRRPVAFVISDDIHLSEDQLSEHLGGLLPTYMMPTAILTLDELPFTENNKIDRKALLALCDAHKSQDHTQPRTPLERKIAELWSQVLHIESPGVHDNFFKLGGHSLLSIQVLNRLQSETQKHLTLTHMFRFPTIAGLAEYIGEDQGGESGPVCLCEESQAPPLFLVHPGSGEIHWYFALAQALKDHFRCYGLQAPGVHGNDNLSDMKELADHHARAILSVQPEGPFRIGGWSVGGAIAVAVTETLEEQGHLVDDLILIDSYHDHDDTRTELTRHALIDFLGDTVRGNRGEFMEWADTIAQLPESERVTTAVAKLAEQGLLPQGTQPEQLEPKFAVYMANRRAANGYTPKPFPGRVRLIRARHTIHDASGFREDADHDESNGWRRLGFSNMVIRNLRGDHYSILHEQHVHNLADLISGAGGRFRLGSTPVQLAAPLQNPLVERMLRGIIGLFETAVPDLIQAWYLMGSWADQKELPESDIDLLLVLGEKPSFRNLEQVHALASHAALLHPYGIDFRFATVSEIERLAPTDTSYLQLLHGEHVNVPSQSMRFNTNMRYKMHTSLFFLREVRYPLTVLRYPLEYPDPKDEFLGYVRQTVVAGGGRETVGTRELVNCLTKPAMGWLAYQSGLYIFNKRAVADNLTKHIDSEWGDFVADALHWCRDVWHYEVPEGQADRERLHAICQKTLDLENAYLNVFRQFLFDELEEVGDLPIPWLTLEEAVQYLGVPQSMIEDELRAGRVITDTEYQETLVYLPHLYRLLAITAFARVIYPDDRAVERLQSLRSGTEVFQSYLVETALARLSRYAS